MRVYWTRGEVRVLDSSVSQAACNNCLFCCRDSMRGLHLSLQKQLGRTIRTCFKSKQRFLPGRRRHPSKVYLRCTRCFSSTPMGRAACGDSQLRAHRRRSRCANKNYGSLGALRCPRRRAVTSGRHGEGCKASRWIASRDKRPWNDRVQRTLPTPRSYPSLFFQALRFGFDDRLAASCWKGGSGTGDGRPHPRGVTTDRAFRALTNVLSGQKYPSAPSNGAKLLPRFTGLSLTRGKILQ
jgi:hypothetical protein